MENKTKPRICEILGVEIGQSFKAVTPHMGYDHLEVDQEGVVWYLGKSWPYKVGPRSLCYMINHPESIHKIPRWTPEEVELAKAIKLIYPTTKSVQRKEHGLSQGLIAVKDGCGEFLLPLIDHRFPSLKSGEVVLISDIIGGDENA